MKTLLATLTLTAMFLSAGAFASNNRAPALHPAKANYTVVEKNQSWPVKGVDLFDTCTATRCFDI